MLTTQSYISNLVVSKVVHAAYQDFKTSPKESSNYILYRSASDTYNYWYALGITSFGLTKTTLAPIIQEGRRIYNHIRKSPSNIETLLNSAYISLLIDMDTLMKPFRKIGLTNLSDRGGKDHYAYSGDNNNPTAMVNALANALAQQTTPVEVAAPSTTVTPPQNAELTSHEGSTEAVSQAQDGLNWVPVRGHELRYECTKSGLIRSIKMLKKLKDGSSKYVGGRLLNGWDSGSGIVVRLCGYGFSGTLKMDVLKARVILSTFSEYLPEVYKVSFKDNDPTNASFDNLEAIEIGDTNTGNLKTDRIAKMNKARLEKRKALLKARDQNNADNSVMMSVDAVKVKVQDNWAPARAALKAKLEAARLNKEPGRVEIPLNIPVVPSVSYEDYPRLQQGVVTPRMSDITIRLPRSDVVFLETASAIIDMDVGDYVGRIVKKAIKKMA